MERNKIKQLAEKRWFLPLVCAVSFAFGWWYLSITTCAPLGGDDEIINLQNYYAVTHMPWQDVVRTTWGGIVWQLKLQSARFRPFSSPPELSLNAWFLGDLVVYRLYILAWTYADIALTAWLTAKATHSKKLGVLAFCLLPMMFSLWQDATGNSMYSYGALAQSTLLPVLLAGLCMLRWQDTRHMRWAVLSAFFMFMACGTFEIGFTYIAALFGIAWLYTGSGKVRPALRLCVAPLAGEVVSFGFNMGSRLVNNLRHAGILPGQAMDIGGVSPNFDLPVALRTWIMQMSAGFPLNAMIFGKIKPGAVQASDVICGIALAVCVIAALAVLDLALLTALVCLCVSLTACSPKEVLKSAILKSTTALGLRQETTDEDEVDNLTYATAGGDVTFPEAMDSTASKLVTEVDGDTMYVAFNGIQNRSTDYFVAGSDSLTVTGYATTESTNENFQTFKVALWELSDDKTATSYLIGSTTYYTTNGSCYQYNISGLTPGKQYKIYISYDSTRYYITGGLKVEGLGSEELTTIETENNVQ